MIEHYGEPVPIRNANMSRNSATPPAASELSSIDNLKEKILEEVIGDVKKMNGAGGKLFNEATASSVDIESKEDKENMINTPYSSQTSLESKDMDNCSMDSIRFKLSSESSLRQETFLEPFQNKEKDGSIDVWWLYA